MQIAHVPPGLRQVGFGLLPSLFGVREVSLGVGQRSFLVRACGHISGALFGAVCHQFLIVLLAVLLLELVLIHLQLQLIADLVNHTDDSTATAAGLGPERCRRLVLPGVGRNLNEALFLLLRRLLVLLGVVELVQAVLGKLQQLQRRVVVGCSLHVRLVLSLALLGCLRDGLVEVLCTSNQRLDLSLQGVNGPFVILDVCILSLDLVLQLLLLVLSLVDLLFAIRDLCVIISLFNLQILHHLIDQLHDLVKILLLPGQGQCNQVQSGVRMALHHRPQAVQSLVSGCPSACLQLHQRLPGRQRLLEHLKSIIAVQHLDGVGQSHELLSPGLLDLVIFLALFIAIFLELSGIALILLQRRLGLVQIILHGCDVHRQIPRSLSLFLDGTLGCSDLLVLGGHQSVEIAHSLVLVVGNLVQPLLHLIFHSLEDTDNLPRHGSPV
mmetsp:Transcript_32784/g.78930  ORF Transcript_32784/g.78930 Transcript_32784/m.78930 type:complete len:439 (-) Transcript_32784:617-1933(-)